MSVDLEVMRSKLQLDAKDFAAGLDSASGKLSGFRRLMASASATAAGFLGASVIQRGIEGVKNQIGGIISAGSDLNETTSKTQQVFGDSFDAINKWASGSARAFGLSKQQALDTVSTYGAMAKAAGQSGTEAVKFGEDLVGAASDLGSFWNFDPSQVAADIQSGLAGESEPLRKYNIYLNETAVKAKAAEMGLVDSNGQLSDENKILARKALIMEQLGPAAGDYARTQKGLANGTRTLTAYFKNFQAWLGGKIVPTVAKAVAFTNMLIARFQRMRAAGLSPLQALLKTIRIQLYQTFGRGVLDAVTAVARGIAWGFNLARDAFGVVTSEIGKWIKVMSWAFSSGLKVSSLVYAFPKPLREVARGFLLMADAVGDAFHAFQSGGFAGLLDQLPNTLGQIWDGLKNIGGAAINFTIDTAVTIAGWLWDHKDDIWGGIKAAVGWTANTFKEAVTATINAGVMLFGWLVDHRDNIWSGIKSAVGWATEKFTESVTAAVTAGILLFGWFMDHKDNIWSGIKSLAGWSSEKFEDAVTVAVDATIALGEIDYATPAASIGSGLVSAVSALTSLGSDVASAVWSQITSFEWASVITVDSFSAGSDFGTAIHDAIVGVTKSAINLITDFSVDDVTRIFKAVAAGMVAAAAAVPVAMALAATAIASFIAGAIKGLVFGDDTDFGSIATKISEGIQNNVTADSMSEAAKAIAGALWDALKAIITGWSWKDIAGWIGGGGSDNSAPDPSNISGPADVFFANPADKARFDASSGVARGQMTPPSVPSVPEGFVSGWHTALASVGADIAEFAKRKTDFTDVKSEVDTASTGSIAALRLMGDATRQVSSVMQAGVHQIANAFAPLPGQLRYYASAAVNGFVSELLRGVAEAQAAATAIAAAVDQAIAKRLQIHSPSRVMANLGRHTVDPFLNELHRGAMEADRFFAGMTTPGMRTAGFAGGGAGVNHYYIIEAGSYVGPAALSEIEKHVATGQAKRIDRTVSSRGLGESF